MGVLPIRAAASGWIMAPVLSSGGAFVSLPALPPQCRMAKLHASPSVNYHRAGSPPTGLGMMMSFRVSTAFLCLASAAAAQNLPPQEAVRRMKPADGFEVTLVASEPQIRQPLSISFDHRGRIWVIQYLQYPTPAGLKATKVDEFLRTTYDRVPEPPPRGPKGADKITILEDRDGDGFYETAKDFVTGLNICSGMCLGYGGVFVAQPPYLLFYPDRNGDDVPDGDPEVLLTGFGMDDTHSVANSLQWGPDGWLYGAAGSTSTSRIRGVEFQ